MTLAHLSDTHLGYRAYGRTTPQGFNQREVDVMLTFRACLESILERDPDIVIHSGDMFHIVRPSNATIVEAHRLLAAFQHKRQGKPFVLIGGNHDSPRTSDSGNILKLFAGIPGLSVAMTGAETLDFGDFEVLCVPSNSLVSDERVEYVPTLNKPHSILTLHGMTKEALPDDFDLEVDQTHSDRWTYVAMGDYHVHKTYGPNCCYAGSTDYTSTNIWEESSTPKGWVWFDTKVGIAEFVALAPRLVLDLKAIDATELTAEEIGERMQANATWDEADLPIVRQRITNVHQDVRPRLSLPLIRDLNRRSLNYRLVLKAPEGVTGTAAAALAPQTIEQSWIDHVAECDVPAGVTKNQVTAIGLEFLREVAEREAYSTEA